MKVLIVEDELGCVVFMEKVIKPYTSEIHVARTMREAKRMLHEIPWLDMICLDLRLPDSSAKETIEHIPTMKVQHPESTILVISGVVDVAKDASNSGAHLFASKMEVLRSPAALLTAVWRAWTASKKKPTQGNFEYCKHIDMLEKFVTAQNKQEIKSDGMLM